jgi:serine/threonine protein kinase
MRQLVHPNIVRYIGAARDEAALTIWMEYIAGGSLADLVLRYGPLPESVVRRYARDIVEGLAYLHSKGIAHRDLKCENLLLCSTGVVKVADFGCSKEAIMGPGRVVATTIVGTPLFMAPEIHLSRPYDPFSTDVWALGITLYQLLRGVPPYHDLALLAAIRAISTNGAGPLPEGISTECADFMQRCVAMDPARRATMTELRAHAFLAVASDDPFSPTLNRTPSDAYARPHLSTDQINRQTTSSSSSTSQASPFPVNATVLDSPPVASPAGLHGPPCASGAGLPHCTPIKAHPPSVDGTRLAPLHPTMMVTRSRPNSADLLGGASRVPLRPPSGSSARGHHVPPME